RAGGGGGRPAVASLGRGSRGRRRAGRRMGPAGGRLRGAAPGRVAVPGGAHRLLPRAPGELQEARGRPLRRRAAEEPHGKDPPQGPPRRARGRVRGAPKAGAGAVRGRALGWGFSAPLGCDLRNAATTAVFAPPDVAAGRLPGGGITQRLPRIVGPARALDLLLLGTPLAARRAA